MNAWPEREATITLIGAVWARANFARVPWLQNLNAESRRKTRICFGTVLPKFVVLCSRHRCSCVLPNDMTPDIKSMFLQYVVRQVDLYPQFVLLLLIKLIILNPPRTQTTNVAQHP